VSKLRESPHWGYRRIAGELKRLGLAASPTTVRKVLTAADVPPAPERARQSWRSFLRQQAAGTFACDFFTIETLALQRIYVLFISLASRRLEFIACTPNPDGAWVTEQARNLVMQLGEQERRFQLLIHDHDTKFSRAFDEVFRSEKIEVIRTPVQAPNANAFAERWVRTVRSDCLDRILILGRRHLEESYACTATTTTSTGRTRQTAATRTLTATLAPRLPSAAATSSAD
jgi:putative transposase